ncbi:photosystem II protein D1-like [Benincasa hispida]|uniref:photosystem II protein D1-like n=1 Tax=Benincasa hispida TaxID=102211 RepID=UPI0018FF3B02|nr:photosystem II protein D1-like [Benincasa hispida]
MGEGYVSGSLLYRNNIISGAIIPTSVAIACYMGRKWELSFRLRMRPWIAVAYSAPVFELYLVRPGITDGGMLWEEGHNIGGDGFE